jgi:hypothetical protein
MLFESAAMESASQDVLAADPDIFNDHSLIADLRALGRVIARQKSPEGDAVAYAFETHVTSADSNGWPWRRSRGGGSPTSNGPFSRGEETRAAHRRRASQMT